MSVDPSEFAVGGVHDRVAVPLEFWTTLIENAGNRTVVRPSLTPMMMFEYAPTLPSVGCPVSTPVVVLKLAQLGRLLIEYVSESPFGSLAVGWNRYVLPTVTEVDGVPLIVGGCWTVPPLVAASSQRLRVPYAGSPNTLFEHETPPLDAAMSRVTQLEFAPYRTRRVPVKLQREPSFAQNVQLVLGGGTTSSWHVFFVPLSGSPNTALVQATPPPEAVTWRTTQVLFAPYRTVRVPLKEHHSPSRAHVDQVDVVCAAAGSLMNNQAAKKEATAMIVGREIMSSP